MNNIMTNEFGKGTDMIYIVPCYHIL